MGPIPELQEQLRAARRAIEDCESVLADLERQEAATASEMDAEAIMRRRAIDEWMQPRTLSTLIDRVVVYPDRSCELHTSVGTLARLLPGLDARWPQKTDRGCDSPESHPVSVFRPGGVA